FFSFLFFLTRPPPTSTLFPYTTLFRSGDDAIFEGLLLGRGMRSFGSGEEEEALGVLAELAGEDAETAGGVAPALGNLPDREALEDRKSTRLNSSHDQISYAVFCLKKKK